LAARAARALEGHESDVLDAALPSLRARMRRAALAQRFEDAARARDRVKALEDVVDVLRELERLRGLAVCVVAPALEPGFAQAFFVLRGRVATTRKLPRGAGVLHEAATAMAEARRVTPSLAAEDAAELRMLATFLRRPPPELRVVPLDPRAIARVVEGLPCAA
jgi:DNA polymerase-3 subunit epsilon